MSSVFVVGHVDHEPVQGVRDLDLTGQAACVLALIGSVEHAVFHVVHFRQFVEPGLVHVAVAGGAGTSSTAFSLVFRGLNGDRFIADALLNLPGGEVGFLLVSMATIFILGFFIDFFEIAFIVVPLFAPIAQQIGIDLVWYGVIIGANMQTSFLTPPFGFALFYLRGIAPKEITTGNIYRGVIPFIILQLLVLVAIIAFPPLVSWLPSVSQ